MSFLHLAGQEHLAQLVIPMPLSVLPRIFLLSVHICDQVDIPGMKPSTSSPDFDKPNTILEVRNVHSFRNMAGYHPQVVEALIRRRLRWHWLGGSGLQSGYNLRTSTSMRLESVKCQDLESV